MIEQEILRMVNDDIQVIFIIQLQIQYAMGGVDTSTTEIVDHVIIISY